MADKAAEPDSGAADSPVAQKIVGELSAAMAARHAAVDAWVVAMINGSVVARDTDAYNYLTQTALPDLKKRLATED